MRVISVHGLYVYLSTVNTFVECFNMWMNNHIFISEQKNIYQSGKFREIDRWWHLERRLTKETGSGCECVKESCYSLSVKSTEALRGIMWLRWEAWRIWISWVFDGDLALTEVMKNTLEWRPRDSLIPALIFSPVIKTLSSPQNVFAHSVFDSEWVLISCHIFL